MYNTELYHHGIKGMKWGVRRFQNKDGTLTAAGKKKYAKEYEKTSNAVTKELNKRYNRMYVDAYNKAANHMNSGGITKFNKDQETRYGKDYAKRAGYEDDYMKAFDEVFARNMNRSLNEFYSTDKNVQKARSLVKKYDMTKWNDLAKTNEANIEEVRRVVEADKRNAEKQRREKMESLFKKHPDLYDEFGGPDQVDDDELLQLVLDEKGYERLDD